MLKCPYCEHELTRQEIGSLYAASRRTPTRASNRTVSAKLTKQDVNHIRKSKDSIEKIAEKYKVSFSTIWRVKESKTHTGEKELKCPHCGHKLTSKRIRSFFASLGGSTSSPRQAKARTAGSRKRSGLTEKDVANIRESSASNRELARKYEVGMKTIQKIRRNEIYKFDSPA